MSKRIFNPAVIKKDGLIHLYFRAMGEYKEIAKKQSVIAFYSEIPGWRTVIAHAVSRNGVDFEIDKKPVIEADSWALRGVEDPRITYIAEEKKWLMAYAAFNDESVHLKIAESHDAINWEVKTAEGVSALGGDWGFAKKGGVYALPGFGGKLKKVLHVNPPDDRWDKSAAIFPEKDSNGNYHMLFGEIGIWHAVSADGYNWKVLDGMFLQKRDGDYFDNAFVEAGPPPIKLTNGSYLVLYHGVDMNYVYRLGTLILDKNYNIVARSKKEVFEPETAVEILGWYYNKLAEDKFYPNLFKKELYKLADEKRRELGLYNPIVIFCCGSLVDMPNDEIVIYYGAGDSVICAAKARLSELVKTASENE